jgi:hypothetical protein
VVAVGTAAGVQLEAVSQALLVAPVQMACENKFVQKNVVNRKRIILLGEYAFFSNKKESCKGLYIILDFWLVSSGYNE